MTEPSSNKKDEGAYKQISALVDNWLELHKGETFDLDTICRQLQVVSRESRNIVTIKLAYEVSRTKKLEKNNKLYRYIDNTIKYIDWVNANDSEVISIKWPFDRELNTYFGFDGHVVISPGDVIVIAGNSNMGKTAFCLNLLWENMDYLPCTLMGNEYSPAKFKRRVKRMDWANPLKDDGTAKFELIERRENWKDIIRPDNINIIDWINLGDNFYQIGMIIDGLQSKLKGGVVVISIQKDPSKEVGLGGRFSEHLSSLYMSIDFERLTVIKAKEWRGHNPNGEMYGFQIVDGGTRFHNIRKVKRCPVCKGNSAIKKYDCQECHGRGYVDDTKQEAK